MTAQDMEKAKARLHRCWQKIKPWAKQLFIAIDQLVNTLLGGWPDETLSSRAWRWHVAGIRHWPKLVIETLFFWDADHCRESFESERQGRQLPPECR